MIVEYAEFGAQKFIFASPLVAWGSKLLLIHDEARDRV